MSVLPFVPTLPTPAAGRTSKPADPVTASTGDADSTTGETALDDFLATLSTAMAGIAQPTPLPADGPVGPTPSGAAEQLSAPVAATPRDLPGSGSGSGSLLAALPGRIADPAGSSAGGEQATVPSTAPVAGAPVASPASLATSTQPSGGEPAPLPLTPPVAGAPLSGSDGDAREGGEGGEQAARRTPTVAAAPAPAQQPDQAPDAGEQATVAPMVADSPQPTATATVAAAATAVTAPTAAVPTSPAPTGTTTAVLRQVFPEVTRVATAATPGTHRVSITLTPESLGEVRVTLLVRAGAVHVSLAADADAAHQALLQGAPELHRLLEATAGDARVTVRDVPPTGSSTATGTGPDQRDGQRPTYSPDTGGDASRHGDDRRTTPARPFDEPTSPRDPRPGSTTGATGTATVHPGRLDRLM